MQVHDIRAALKDDKYDIGTNLDDIIVRLDSQIYSYVRIGPDVKIEGWNNHYVRPVRLVVRANMFGVRIEENTKPVFVETAEHAAMEIKRLLAIEMKMVPLGSYE